jgi:hypothetical protein
MLHRRLLEAGANPDIATLDGQLPVDMAEAKYGRYVLVIWCILYYCIQLKINIRRYDLVVQDTAQNRTTLLFSNQIHLNMLIFVEVTRTWPP